MRPRIRSLSVATQCRPCTIGARLDVFLARRNNERDDHWVSRLEFSPTGKRLAGIFSDSAVYVWDAESGESIHGTSAWWSDKPRRLNPADICGDLSDYVAVSPNEMLIASISDHGLVNVWETGKVGEVPHPIGHDGPVHCVRFSPDGKQLASGSDDSTVRLWDSTNGREMACLHGHKGPIWDVAFSADGRMLATASGDQTVAVWDVVPRERVHSLKGHRARVSSVAFSPESGRPASGGWDKTVRVWDIASGLECACLIEHKAAIASVAFSAEGLLLASGGLYGQATACVWDTRTYQLVSFHPEPSWPNVIVSFTPQGQLIIGSSNDLSTTCNAQIRWGPVASGPGTVVADTSRDLPIAWMPLTPRVLASDPTGRTCAALAGGKFCLFVMESGSSDTITASETAAATIIDFKKTVKSCDDSGKGVQLLTVQPDSRTVAQQLEGITPQASLSPQTVSGKTELANPMRHAGKSGGEDGVFFRHLGFGELEMTCKRCGYSECVERGEPRPNSCPECGSE